MTLSTFHPEIFKCFIDWIHVMCYDSRARFITDSQLYSELTLIGFIVSTNIRSKHIEYVTGTYSCVCGKVHYLLRLSLPRFLLTVMTAVSGSRYRDLLRVADLPNANTIIPACVCSARMRSTLNRSWGHLWANR